MKKDETKDIPVWPGRSLHTIAEEAGASMIGSAAPMASWYYPWPKSCPVCQSHKLAKTYWITNTGYTLMRECARCSTHFGVQART